MRYSKMALVGVLALGIGVAACDQQGPKQTIGTLGGAALGGLAGAQIGKGSGQLAATAVGVLLGGFLGSEVGKSLDKADQAYAAQTTGQALEYNKSYEQSTWQNPDSGHSGSVTPVRTSYNDAGQPCREYQQTVTVGGKTETAYGTACRDANGDWRIVSQD
jgi:surface antigen